MRTRRRRNTHGKEKQRNENNTYNIIRIRNKKKIHEKKEDTIQKTKYKTYTQIRR